MDKWIVKLLHSGHVEWIVKVVQCTVGKCYFTMHSGKEPPVVKYYFTMHSGKELHGCKVLLRNAQWKRIARL